MKVILIGFMGSGKSTISKLLGQKLNLEVRDLDQVIMDYENSSIHDIFLTKGEPYFRKLEFKMLQQQVNFDGILATGGGTIINDNCASHVKNLDVPVVLLEISDDTIAKRLGHQAGRPIASSKTAAELIELKHDRNGRYHECADFVVQTDQKNPQEVVEEIIKYLE
ncbi:shikimate kinase [Fructilactobacillus frigidiflavus]|uniref:shikimate kinase n=1 Tax=Fructilactobacillus frigidiflavus TaxID=3242688 RepID=UPI003757CCCA